MFKEYSINNFKIHKEGYPFDLDGLTILTGTNNSGKSSLTQSLRLISATNDKIYNYTRLPFENIEELKDFSRTLNKEVRRNDSIKYKFSLDIESFEFCSIELEFESIYNYNIPFKEMIDQAILSRLDIYFKSNNGIVKNFEFFINDSQNNNLTYDFNEIILSNEDERKLIQSGVIFRGLCPNFIPNPDLDGGRELLYIVTKLGSINSNSIKYVPAHRGAFEKEMAELLDDFNNQMIFDGQNTLGNAFNIWTKKILNSQFKIRIQDNIRRVISIDNNTEFDLSQIGFGNTQILPILVAILTANKGDLVIIENPEVHLHPKWKTNLVELFYYAVQYGVNILIETQSLEIVNRIRLSIKKDNSLKDKTSLYFFEKHNFNSIIQKIEIERTGSLDSWPDDFIDKVSMEDNFDLM